MHPPITITAADAQEAAKDDATPAPIPDVSYALTICRERIALLNEAIDGAKANEDFLTGDWVKRAYGRFRTTLEQTRDDLRKIERALLGET